MNVATADTEARDDAQILELERQETEIRADLIALWRDRADLVRLLEQQQARADAVTEMFRLIASVGEAARVMQVECARAVEAIEMLGQLYDAGAAEELEPLAADAVYSAHQLHAAAGRIRWRELQVHLDAVEREDVELQLAAAGARAPAPLPAPPPRRREAIQTAAL